MVEILTSLITNLNALTNILLVIVMLVSLAMIAYPEPSVRYNGTIAFLVTLLAAALTNLPISVV
ncbi:MAG: hypothetical protein WC492_04920 [Candidatus Micrarchaeia archaeon]